MSKYTPSPEDLYSTTPCPVCGQDAIEGETCCDLCQQAWEIFKKDFEEDLRRWAEQQDEVVF
jgi:hypothetical protein